LAIQQFYNKKRSIKNDKLDTEKNIEHFYNLYPIDLNLKSSYEGYQDKLRENEKTREKFDINNNLLGHPEYTCFGGIPECLDYIFCDEKYFFY